MATIRQGVRTRIEVVREYAKKLGGELISNEYSNMLTKMEWQCSLGHHFIATFNHVKNRGQWCPMCGKEKGLANMRKTFSRNDEVKRKISCSNRGLSLENFNGFVSETNRKKNKLKRSNYRYRNELEYKIKLSLRNRLSQAIKNNQKSGSAVKDLGCTIKELKLHLESKFQPGMSWDNYGFRGWHIDHIRPLSSFDLTDKKQFKMACHYSNLQPLWAGDNLRKGSKYE